MKSGIKSTEFWLTFAAMALGGFVASGILPSTHWSMQVCGLAVAALGQLGYTASRGKIKAENEKQKRLPTDVEG